MYIDIFKSTKDGSKYLSVAKGTKVEELDASSLDPDLLSLSPFKTRLEIQPSKKHPALDQNDIIKQIEEKGYAEHGAKATITLK